MRDSDAESVPAAFILTGRAIRVCICAVSVFLVSSATAAETPAGNIPVTAFAQLPQIASPVLSPDGKAFAFVHPEERRHQLVVQEIADPSTIRVTDTADDASIDWLQWVSDDHLVFATRSTGKLAFDGEREDAILARVFALQRTRSPVRELSVRNQPFAPRGFHRGHRLVSALPDDPLHVLIADDLGNNGNAQVRRINLETGRSKVVQQKSGINHWLADQSGQVRYGSGLFDRTYRPRHGKFRGARKHPWLADGWLPVAFDEHPAIVLVAGYGQHGTRELRRLGAIDGDFLETLYSDPRYSLDEVLVDRNARAYGVRYTDDHERVRYVDAELAGLARAADRALPDTVNELVSFSDDRRVLIVHATSDVDPGFFNLWDREAGTLESIGVTMPGLDPGQMSPTRPVSFESPDGLTIPAYLTVPAGAVAKGLPAVVLQHEGLGARADAGFDFLVQFLASRGYAVLQPNGRGSSGYTREFTAAGDGEWGGLMQGDLAAAAAWLVDEGIADAQRICIAGRVYGGYAAAMAAIETPESFRCAISVNGILDLMDFSTGIGRYLGSEFPRGDHGLSGDDPQSVSPYARARSVAIPMLIMHVRDSLAVPYGYAERMARRLRKLDKPVRLVDLGPGGLDVYDPASRQLMLESIETFLDTHLGGRRGL